MTRTAAGKRPAALFVINQQLRSSYKLPHDRWGRREPPPRSAWVSRKPARRALVKMSQMGSSSSESEWEEVLSCGRHCPYAYDGECDDGGTVR